MATLRLLDSERRIVDGRDYGNGVNRGPMPLDDALALLKAHRSECYRHVWDVRMVPTFWDDYEKLGEEMREAVILAVSALANAKFPTNTGHDTNAPGLTACEIGRSYRLVFNFIPSMHQLVLFFVGKNDDVEDCDPSMVFPSIRYYDGKSVKAEERHAEIINDGYARDIWEEVTGGGRKKGV